MLGESVIPPVDANASSLADVSVAINRVQGGRRGDLVDRASSFGDGFTVTTADFSPRESWTEVRMVVSIVGRDLDVIMRAQDGRSGSDEPNRCFSMGNNTTGETWKSVDQCNEARPDWVDGFLGKLALANAELVPAQS